LKIGRKFFGYFLAEIISITFDQNRLGYNSGDFITDSTGHPARPTNIFLFKKTFFFFVEHWFPRKGKRALRTDLVQSRRFAEKN
jgi:hypothetical protein